MANLVKDHVGSRLVVRFGELWDSLEGAVLAVLKHKVLFILAIKVIVHLVNPIGFADSLNIRKLENYVIFALKVGAKPCIFIDLGSF